MTTMRTLRMEKKTTCPRLYNFMEALQGFALLPV
jgi:hypothetical protein